MKYQSLLKRIESIEQQIDLIQKDRIALTNEFQIQFTKIEQILGCLANAIEQLRSHQQSE